MEARDKPYLELRRLLAVNFMTIKEYAQRLGRCEDYIAQRLNGSRAWALEDAYKTLDLFHRPVEDIKVLFPRGGKSGQQRRRKGYKTELKKLEVAE